MSQSSRPAAAKQDFPMLQDAEINGFDDREQSTNDTPDAAMSTPNPNQITSIINATQTGKPSTPLKSSQASGLDMNLQQLPRLSINNNTSDIAGTNDEAPRSEDIEPNPTSEESVPDDNIPPFDWKDFGERYNEAMTEAYSKEDVILKEYETHAQFFKIWNDAASNYDEDRAFKRLKTREVFIRNEEFELEKKQEHHNNVVDAFRKALELLGG